jgi:hypothetical protein
MGLLAMGVARHPATKCGFLGSALRASVEITPATMVKGLFEDRNVDGVATRWGGELGVAFGIGGAIVRMGDVVAIPRDRLEFLILPLGLY